MITTIAPDGAAAGAVIKRIITTGATECCKRCNAGKAIATKIGSYAFTGFTSGWKEQFQQELFHLMCYPNGGNGHTSYPSISSSSPMWVRLAEMTPEGNSKMA